ncbi:effector-associated constant component EACC1 [Streptomyces sp. NPDC005071]
MLRTHERGGIVAADGAAVELVLDAEDDDREYVEDQLQYLLAELGHLDIASIERSPSLLPTPPGARSSGALELGALVIGLGSSGALLPTLVGLVQDWLNRRRSGTIRIKIGDDEIELTASSDEMRQRALEEFLRRHGE